MATNKENLQDNSIINIELVQAIVDKDYKAIKTCLNNINYIDENILDIIIKLKDIDAFKLVSKKLQLNNPTECFLQAGDNDLNMALEILKIYKDDFRNNYDFLEYDNYINDSLYDEVFPKEYQLPRFYQSCQFSNSLETFAVMLLDQSLNYMNYSQTSSDILDYLLENKKEFNLKDELFVQFLVEKSYKIENQDNYKVFLQSSPNENTEKLNKYPSYNVSSEEINYKFKIPKTEHTNDLYEIIEKLVRKNISFESDSQGYLAQIITINKNTNLNHTAKILSLMKKNGSSITTFLERFQDKYNRATPEQEYELTSYSNNHQYNIYKRFDTGNQIIPELIQLCQKIDNTVSFEKNYTKDAIKIDEFLTILLEEANCLHTGDNLNDIDSDSYLGMNFSNDDNFFVHLSYHSKEDVIVGICFEIDNDGIVIIDKKVEYHTTINEITNFLDKFYKLKDQMIDNAIISFNKNKPQTKYINSEEEIKEIADTFEYMLKNVSLPPTSSLEAQIIKDKKLIRLFNPITNNIFTLDLKTTPETIGDEKKNKLIERLKFNIIVENNGSRIGRHTMIIPAYKIKEYPVLKNFDRTRLQKKEIPDTVNEKINDWLKEIINFPNVTAPKIKAFAQYCLIESNVINKNNATANKFKI